MLNREMNDYKLNQKLKEKVMDKNKHSTQLTWKEKNSFSFIIDWKIGQKLKKSTQEAQKFLQIYRLKKGESRGYK